MSWIDCVPGRTVRGANRLYLRAALDGGGRLLQAWAHDPTPGGTAPQVVAFQVEDDAPVITDLPAGGQNVVLPVGRAVGWTVFVQRTKYTYDALVVHLDSWWGWGARDLPFPDPEGTSQGFLQWRDGQIAFTDQHHVLHPDGTTSGDVNRPRVLIRPTRTDDGVWFGQHPYQARACIWRASEPTILRVVFDERTFEPRCAIDPDGRYRFTAMTARSDREAIHSPAALNALPAIPLPTPPDPPDVPPPVTDPPKEPPVSYTPTAPNLTSLVADLAARYPQEWADAHSGNPHTERFIRRFAWEASKRDPKFALNGKRGTAVISQDAVSYANPASPAGGVEIIDVIRAAGGPEAAPQWLDVTQGTADAGEIGKWIAPSMPDWDVEQPPKEPPDKPPTKPPDVPPPPPLTDPVDYGTFLAEGDAVDAALRDALGHAPGAADLYHNAWRRLSTERWAHRDIIRAIYTERGLEPPPE